MKATLFLGFVFLSAALLSTYAIAQCGETKDEGLEVHCCDNTYVQPDDSCTTGGPPSQSCTEGVGTCCDVEHHSATNYPNDPSCCTEQECQPHYIWVNCHCQFASPIIIDTAREGFRLTSAEDGVVFDIAGTGKPVGIAWTSGTSRNAFLALDRNRNGRIDDGLELFGNLTRQSPSAKPNGFLALAEFDKLENGGNHDGVIDKRDIVFSHLLLWIDRNHNAISEAGELYSLPQLGVLSISLEYMESRWSDRFGNQFRFKTAINPGVQNRLPKDGRWAYDVFFMTVDTQPTGRALRRGPLSATSSNGCSGVRDFRVLLNERLDLGGWGLGPGSVLSGW